MLASIKKYFLYTLAFIVGVSFLSFAIVNREMVTLKFTPFPWEVEMRLFLFTGLLILVGVFIGWVAASFECRKRYLVKKETQKRIAALEEEVTSLRAHSRLDMHHVPPETD